MSEGVWTVRSAQRNALLCAVVIAVCVLLTIPVVESPVVDDFSYTKSAFDYARTGHILYNGWATTMLGWQVMWGGLFVKLFGYSFMATRLSILPFAMGSVALLHLILTTFGATPWNATLGTLTLGLSPMFIPLSTSFMSDVPAVFCILLCLYLCQRAAYSSNDRAAIAWLTAAAVSNVLDGTVRQIVWLGALLMVPSAAWVLRRRPPVLLVAVILWPLSALSIIAFMNWFKQQPYAVPLAIWEPPVSDLLSRHFFIQMLYFMSTLLLLALPLLIASVVGRFHIMRWHRLSSYAAMLTITGLLVILLAHHPLDHVLAPWMGNIVTKFGMNFSLELTASAVVMPAWARFIGTLLLAFSLISTAAILLDRLPRFNRSPLNTPVSASGWQTAAVLTIPFSVGYLATVILRAMHHELPDRYVLPLLPILVILFVLFYQQWLGERLPKACVGLLAIFGAYAICGTHDFFSAERARLEAARGLERAGVPRSLIHISPEYSAWNQLEMHGHLEPGKIPVPMNSRYFVVPEPSPFLLGTRVGPIEYCTWLPPFRRRFFVQALPNRGP